MTFRYDLVKVAVEKANYPFHGNFAGCSEWEAWASLHENSFFSKLDEMAFQPNVGDIVLYDNVFLNQKHDHIGIIIEGHHDSYKVVEGNMAILPRLLEDL